MEPEDLPRPKPKFTVGDPLDTVSVNELHERIDAFAVEIERIRNEISKKQASKSAAESFFKS